jgi:hypothetical protein
MNPDRVWRELANDALARQIVSEHYGLFVAMPFRDQFSYRSESVFADVIEVAIEDTRGAGLPRPFAKPIRADRLTPNASEITEDIVEAILYNHFFLADLTMANQGVLVELGIALALKSPRQVILIAQGNLSDLHFDIKDNRVIQYDQPGASQNVARALIEGASKFEASVGDRMAAIRKSLSPQAVYLLNLYGRLRKHQPGLSLHSGAVQEDANLSVNPALRELLFYSAAQELQNRGLIALDYAVADDQVTPDRFGFHATKLGLVFIRQTWPRSFEDLR